MQISVYAIDEYRWTDKIRRKTLHKSLTSRGHVISIKGRKETYCRRSRDMLGVSLVDLGQSATFIHIYNFSK